MAKKKPDEQQVVSNEGDQRKYFHMMLNMADDDLDPFEYRALGHYIRCAGHGGSHAEGIRESAAKTQMSVVKFRQSRANLVTKGYLKLRESSVEEQKLGIPSQVKIIDRWAENIMRYTRVKSDTPPVSNMTQGNAETRVKSDTPPVSNMTPLEEQVEEPKEQIEEESSPKGETVIEQFIEEQLDMDDVPTSYVELCQPLLPIREQPDPTTGLYPVTHQNKVALIEAWFNWCKNRALSKSSKVLTLSDEIKNKGNLATAEQLWSRGVRPIDVVKCVAFKQRKDERLQKPLPFPYWAKVIEEWTASKRKEQAGEFTPSSPRTAGRTPDCLIEMGDITHLQPCEFLYRQLTNPNLYIDVPPRYIPARLPAEPAEDDEEYGGDLDPAEVEEVVALLGEL